MCPLLVFGPDVLMSVLGSGAFLGPYRAQIFLSSESMWRLIWTSTGAMDGGKFSFREIIRYDIVWASVVFQTKQYSLSICRIVPVSQLEDHKRWKRDLKEVKHIMPFNLMLDSIGDTAEWALLAA
jgi:hypothetical protein